MACGLRNRLIKLITKTEQKDQLIYITHGEEKSDVKKIFFL